MCTTAVKKLGDSWFLIKTRDPVTWMQWDDEIKLFNEKGVDSLKKYIVQNPDPNADGYYGGINEKGVAIVATFVRVTQNQISYLRKPYIRLILEAETAQEAVEIIKSFNPKIGGNIFVADKNECYGIEAIPTSYYVEKVGRMGVKTNHFQHFKEKDADIVRDPSLLQWSETHYKRALELIKLAENEQDLMNILKDRKNAEKGEAICTTGAEDKCYTYSAFVFDTAEAKAYYCQGNPLEQPFELYQF